MKNKIAFLTICSLLLSGCMTLMKTKQEIKHAEYKNENVQLNGNYQSLLKCWDDNSSKLTIDWVNQTSTQIYQDIGLAEIYGGGAGGRYAALVELKKISPNKTTMNAYGTGWLGQKYVPEWVDVLQTCSTK